LGPFEYETGVLTAAAATVSGLQGLEELIGASVKLVRQADIEIVEMPKVYSKEAKNKLTYSQKQQLVYSYFTKIFLYDQHE
jgi:hypothetical protein